jgi:hypothetical protein
MLSLDQIARRLLLIIAVAALLFLINCQINLSNVENNLPLTALFADNIPTIHNLHIENLKVIASLGDSITAGYGANDDSFIENRGVSFAMGNDPGVVTLPNVISKYQPVLIGPSEGNHIVQVW